jgi:hypothetical protein
MRLPKFLDVTADLAVNLLLEVAFIELDYIVG